MIDYKVFEDCLNLCSFVNDNKVKIINIVFAVDTYVLFYGYNKPKSTKISKKVKLIKKD